MSSSRARGNGIITFVVADASVCGRVTNGRDDDNDDGDNGDDDDGGGGDDKSMLIANYVNQT